MRQAGDWRVEGDLRGPIRSITLVDSCGPKCYALKRSNRLKIPEQYIQDGLHEWVRLAGKRFGFDRVEPFVSNFLRNLNCSG
jgi:hypothetical protein